MFSLCSACPVVPRRSPVLSSGPVPSRLLFLLEAPAKNEDAQGIPAVGHTGFELDNSYLPICALFRDQVHVANSVLCSQPSYRNPKPHEALACSSHHLPALLSRVQPQIIVTMGAVSLSLFPHLQLTLHHGRPHWCSFGDWSGWVFPTFHPAAGLRSTAYMIPLRQDFRDLNRFMKALDADPFLVLPQDPYPNPDYRVIRTERELQSYLLGPIYDLATDTEARGMLSKIPHCLTISRTPGTGRLIYARDLDLLCAYALLLHQLNPLFLLHNYLYDVSVLSRMGISIPPRRFLDTMIRAYELGLGGGGDDDEEGAARGSLGLKTLAYRHLNMQMRSFKDTVTPYALPLVLDWLISAQGLTKPLEPVPICVCGCLQVQHEQRGKTQRYTGKCLKCSSCERCKLIKPPPRDRSLGLLHRRINNLVTGMFSGSVTDPWKRLEPNLDEEDGGWQIWEIDMLTEMIGPLPQLDIGLVPEDVLVNYACQDSDATLRLNSFLNTYKIES